jgi:2',3'-cyclic-nucleotide 2'-phosphodiesterase (5'-nucleotidase family)
MQRPIVVVAAVVAAVVTCGGCTVRRAQPNLVGRDIRLMVIEQMFNVFPFENTIVVMYLSGVEVQDTLDFVARRSAERGCRSQAQVAGVRVTEAGRRDHVPAVRSRLDAGIGELRA